MEKQLKVGAWVSIYILAELLVTVNYTVITPDNWSQLTVKQSCLESKYDLLRDNPPNNHLDLSSPIR